MASLNPSICCGPSTWSTFIYTKLEGPSIAKLDLHFPQDDLWMIWRALICSWSQLLACVYRRFGMVHMGSQVPSPTHVSKSQHGGKVPPFELQETIETWLIIIKIWSKLFWCKYICRVVFQELSLAFCSTQLTTQVPSLTSKKCCHVGIHVILGT